MEKTIGARQWDRELKILNKEISSERKMKLDTILQNHHGSWKYHRRFGKYDSICIVYGTEYYFYIHAKTWFVFRSRVATSHLHPPMAFLSHNSSDTPGLAPLMNVLFGGRCDFPISFSGRDMSRNV